MRAEDEIFQELLELCLMPGFIHAIAHICFRDHFISLSEAGVTPEALLPQYDYDRLIRTEISTLIGLMLRGDIDLSLPAPDVVQQMVDASEALLQEIHKSMISGFMGKRLASLRDGNSSGGLFDASPRLLDSGRLIREAIFYGGESAYIFQYTDLARQKYANDNNWLAQNKGFSIEQACEVVDFIRAHQPYKMQMCLEKLKDVDPVHWTMLPAFEISLEEIAKNIDLSPKIIRNILDSFTCSDDDKNDNFNTVSSFNMANAFPLIRGGDDTWILLQSCSLAEALYESPFYWFSQDSNYRDTAMRHRGKFTEEFSYERLVSVFGEQNVYTNINIVDAGGNRAGEIDVLVVYADRAIVLQAKSKKLTIESRKGNDNCIKEDFEKAIQHSYDQGFACAELIIDDSYKFIDGSSDELIIDRNFKKISVLCVVSDHYPALSYQSRQFLKFTRTDKILPPFVMDVFLLDIIAEFLNSPLYFLSYVDRRAQYYEQITASQELTVLSYHLRSNLWKDDEFDFVHLEDDISASLDAAILVRREGIEGIDTPEGILTKIKGMSVGRIISQIEAEPHPTTIELGYLLLGFGEDALIDLSKGIDAISEMSKDDGKHHDLTLGCSEADSGLTVHCNYEPDEIAGPKLFEHCERRKYSQKASSWVGLCVSPLDQSIRFAVSADFPWQQNDGLDEITRDLPSGEKNLRTAIGILKSKKIGRNDPCPCGSGKKYKKCHLN